MRDYATVRPSFWTGKTGKRIRSLGPDAQRVALYLMTSPHSNMIGLYYIPIPTLEHEVGLPSGGAWEPLASLSRADFAHYDDDTETVWVPEMARYQIGETLSVKDNKRKGVMRELEKYRKTPFYRSFLERYCAPFSLPEPPPEPSPSEGPPEPLRSQEQEQEQEQEQDSSRAPAREAEAEEPSPFAVARWFDDVWAEVHGQPLGVQPTGNDRRRCVAVLRWAEEAAVAGDVQGAVAMAAEQAIRSGELDTCHSPFAVFAKQPGKRWGGKRTRGPAAPAKHEDFDDDPVEVSSA